MSHLPLSCNLRLQRETVLSLYYTQSTIDPVKVSLIMSQYVPLSITHIYCTYHLLVSIVVCVYGEGVHVSTLM